jgi:acyl dehydratase
MGTISTSMPTKPIEIDEGASGPEATVGPITRIAIVKYAGAGGDFNPVHCDEEFARAAGLPSVFSHGLLSAGLVGQYVARWVGLPNVRKLTIRFTGQVWPDDTLTLGGRVERVEETGGERLAHIELSAARQTGDVVVKASAVARVA